MAIPTEKLFFLNLLIRETLQQQIQELITEGVLFGPADAGRAHAVKPQNWQRI